MAPQFAAVSASARHRRVCGQTACPAAISRNCCSAASSIGNPTVIVAHSPTQGLDIAATAAAHNALIDAAARGAAVIVISPDLDELIAMADRIVVLSAGKIVDALDLRSEPFDAARIGRAMAVGQLQDHAM